MEFRTRFSIPRYNGKETKEQYQSSQKVLKLSTLNGIKNRESTFIYYVIDFIQISPDAILQKNYQGQLFQSIFLYYSSRKKSRLRFYCMLNSRE